MNDVAPVSNKYPTNYPEMGDRAEELKREYHKRLEETWIRRRKGLSHDAILALGMIYVLFVLIGGVPFLYALAKIGINVSGEKYSVGYFLAAVYGAVFLGAYLLFLSRININKRTNHNTFSIYPKVARAGKELADQDRMEVIRDFLPLLMVEDRKIFYLAFIISKEDFVEPTGIVIVNEEGRLLENDAWLEKATLTVGMGIKCGHLVQMNEMNKRRPMNNVINHLVPNAFRVLRRQGKAFRQHGAELLWKNILEEEEMLPTALRESSSIQEGEKAYRKAMGYAFALEFRYEDAEKLRALYLSYIRYMNAAFRQRIIALTANAEHLIQIIQSDPEWSNKDVILRALAILATAGPNGVLSWVWQREIEGMVTDDERRVFHEKTAYARGKGWPVVG